jgi:ParB/RepB/Spo0J family partition protein
MGKVVLENPPKKNPKLPPPATSIAWIDNDGRDQPLMATGTGVVTFRAYRIERYEDVIGTGKEKDVAVRFRWVAEHVRDRAFSQSPFKSIDEAKRSAEAEEADLVRKKVKLGKEPLQLPAGTLEDQMAEQLGGFVSRGQAAQKAVDAELLAVTPFPVSKGAQVISLCLLVESPKNPRQDFGDLDDLAKSIKSAGGLLVPIIARPLPNSSDYEIVDGARRFRALKLLQKTGWLDEDAEVRVDVRELTDAQAFEAMMMADQRETLKPMEQARGYANMIATGHTPDTIADQLGVSKGTVIGRLKLLELGPKAMKLFEAGLLTTAIATPLGRYPHELQDEALDQMLNDRNREGMGGPDLWRYEERHKWSGPKFLNVGKCIAWLQEKFTKSLKTTPWDQEDDTIAVHEDLWPTATMVEEGTVLAPSCAKCPKNSNNMHPEIAGENAHGRSSAGFCTLPPCFEAKWAESLQRLRTEAKEKGDVKVLSESASRSALKKITNSDSKFARASEVCHEDSKKRTWGQLLELANKEIDDAEKIRKVVAISEEEGRAQLVEKDVVQKVLAAQKVLPKPKPKAEKRRGYDHAAWQAQREREDAKRELLREIAADVLKQYTELLRKKGPTLPVLRMLLNLEDAGTEDLELETFGLKNERELEAFVEKKGTVNDLIALLYMRLARSEVLHVWNGFKEETERTAKELKIDLKQREKDAIAAAKLAAKAKKGETETLEEGDE